jgi:hypothetical protein
MEQWTFIMNDTEILSTVICLTSALECTEVISIQCESEGTGIKLTASPETIWWLNYALV